MSTIFVSKGVELEAIVIQESMEQALDSLCPIHPPSSSLEARANAMWTLEDGTKAYIPPPLIQRVYE